MNFFSGINTINLFTGKNLLLLIVCLVLIGIIIFLLMREVACWYFKINYRIKLQEEADRDRKDILRLLLELTNKEEDGGEKKEESNTSDKIF